MGTLEITAFHEDDYQEWLIQWTGFLAFYDMEMVPETTNKVWQRLMNEDYPLYGFKAVKDGAFIGFVHYYFHGSTWSPTGYCYLEDLFVSENARGTGCGRQLISAVKEAAKERGATKVYWHMDGGNDRARVLYDQMADLSDFVRYEIKLT